MGVAPSTVTRVYIFRYVFLTYIYLYRKIEFQHHLKTSPLSQESLRLHCPTKITCFYKNSSEKVRWNLRTRTNFLRKMEKIWTDFFQPFVFRRLGCLVFQLNRFNTQILRNPGRPWDRKNQRIPIRGHAMRRPCAWSLMPIASMQPRSKSAFGHRFAPGAMYITSFISPCNIHVTSKG